MPIRTFTPFPILKTYRLVWRQPATTDDVPIFALRSNENVNKYLDRNPSRSIADAQSFIAAVNQNIEKNNAVYWAITLNDQLIGTICLFGFSDADNTAEIGYELLPDYQGKGFMREALRAVIQYGFEHTGLHAITAYTHCENQSSTKLLEQFNFKRALQLVEDGHIVGYKLSKQES